MRKATSESAENENPAKDESARLAAAIADGRLTTLRELFAEEERLNLTKALVNQLAKKVAVFGKPSKSTIYEIERMHVTSLAQAPSAVGSGEVLIGLLRRKAMTSTARAHTVAELKNMVPDKWRPHLSAALKERERTRRWPPGVGALRASRALLVFLLDDIVARPPHPKKAASAPERLEGE